MRDFAQNMIEAARELCAAVARIKFTAPITHVYNPLDYAWRPHEAYLRRFADSRKRVVFLGMNPGPFGMVQTGVPFGEINAVRDWLRIETLSGKPRREHPRRPVVGFACPRSEVSGKRLWSLFADRFGSAENFFADHFVVNYCPLAFFDKDGRNLTPNKLTGWQASLLFAACDRHLRRATEILEAEWLVGIGDFAAKRARLLLDQRELNNNRAALAPPRGQGTMRFPGAPRPQVPERSSPRAARRRPPNQKAVLKIGRILHPSPASPAANKDWARKATAELKALGVWR